MFAALQGACTERAQNEPLKTFKTNNVQNEPFKTNRHVFNVQNEQARFKPLKTKTAQNEQARFYSL